MRERILLAVFILLLVLIVAGCAKPPPGQPLPRGRETPVTPAPAPSGPTLRAGAQTVKENQPFSVAADVPDLTNVDLFRLYQNGALWEQLPLSAISNKQITFTVGAGLKAGSYTLAIRTVNAEPSGERETDSDSIALTVVGVPPPPKFTIGQRIQVYSGTAAGVGAAVRQPSFGFSSPVVGSHPAKHAGTVLDGPQSADGYVWWRLDYDASTVDGWTTETNLDPCAETECKDVPPPDVDCVVTEWSEWAPVSDEWSACVDAKQSRVEYRHRDVTTHPAGNGALCPILQEERTVEQPCAVTLPAPTILEAGTQCRWRFQLTNSPDGTTGWTAQLQKGTTVFVGVGNADSTAPYVVTTPYQGGNTTATFSFKLTKPGRPEQRTALVTVTCGVPQ